MEPLVSADWLRAHLGDAGLTVVDCRFALGSPGAGRQAYLEGHVAGAAHLDLDRDLSSEPGAGRHPLPTAEAFGASARRAGIRQDRPVVAYDAGMDGGAARLWWLLRHFGKDDVAVLDGGFAAWRGPVATGEEAPEPGDFVPRPRSGDTVDRDALLAGLGRPGRVLLDARAPERYRGETEPIDPVAGHIPGARNLPLVDAFPPPADVVESGEELVVYCGSGVAACAVLLALEAAGRSDAKLYPGSWSDWCTAGLPVATGEG